SSRHSPKFAASARERPSVEREHARAGDAGRPSRIARSSRPSPRTYTLRYGDVGVSPQAATRCPAEGEAGIPNLFCERTSRGRYQVIFYSDCVLVWPLSRGPDGPPISYAWGPKRR